MHHRVNDIPLSFSECEHLSLAHIILIHAYVFYFYKFIFFFFVIITTIVYLHIGGSSSSGCCCCYYSVPRSKMFAIFSARSRRRYSNYNSPFPLIIQLLALHPRFCRRLLHSKLSSTITSLSISISIIGDIKSSGGLAKNVSS